jgi:hypothetical protein
MDQHRLPPLTRSLTSIPSRRDVLHALAAAGLALGVARFPGSAEAKKKRKRKQALCRKDGSPCRKAGKTCKKGYCLSAPFTIEAKWTESQTADHDTFLFVPPENATTGPTPYVTVGCNPTESNCETDVYPFVCVSQDARGPGDEVTTVRRLLDGTYEYWIGLDHLTLAGELTIVLRDSNGHVVRGWTNPANPSTQSGVSWHVFDIDGDDGRVTSIDEPIDGGPPQQVNEPSTEVCPK